MLLFCSHLQETQYYLGRYEDDRFHPEHYARMSWPGGHLGGGITMLDGNEHRIFFDWIREAQDVETQRASGWSGVMTVPRVLCLASDGNLRLEPVPKLEMLQLNHRKYANIDLIPDAELTLDDVRGDCLELAVEMDVGDALEFGVKVRSSRGGEEQTPIVCNHGAQTLSVEANKSSLDASCVRYAYYRNEKANERLPEASRTVDEQAVPFELCTGESLQLRIFLDRSVLEVFANGRQCVTQRIYPSRSDSLGVVLFSRVESVNVRPVETWDMAPIVE